MEFPSNVRWRLRAAAVMRAASTMTVLARRGRSAVVADDVLEHRRMVRGGLRATCKQSAKRQRYHQRCQCLLEHASLLLVNLARRQTPIVSRTEPKAAPQRPYQRVLPLDSVAGTGACRYRGGLRPAGRGPHRRYRIGRLIQEPRGAARERAGRDAAFTADR